MVSLKATMTAGLVSLVLGACRDHVPGLSNNRRLDAMTDTRQDAHNNPPKDMSYDSLTKDGSFDGMTSDMEQDSRVDSGFNRDASLDGPLVRDSGFRDDGGTVDSGPRLDGYIVDMLSPDLGRDSSVSDMGRDLGTDTRADGLTGPRPFECDLNTVALYHFDQSFPFLDSCREHHLTDHSTTEVAGEPGFGEARSYVGAESYLDTPETPDLNFGETQDFTMEARVKMTTTPETQDFIIGKLPRGTPSSGYGIFYYGGEWTCTYWDSGSSAILGSGLTLADGLWHNISCARYNLGTRVDIHIDETLVASGEIVLTNVNHIAPVSLIIGNSDQGLGHGWGQYSGEIDEVRISDIARYGGT